MRFCAEFPSGCRGESSASPSALTAVYIFSEHGVDGRLVTFAALAKERQHIGIEAKRDLLLLSRPQYRSSEEIRSLLWNVGVVNVFISERVNSLPVRP